MVEIKQSTDELIISVTDQGSGLPDDFDLRKSASLGMKLVHSLAKQLRGQISFDRCPGTRATLRIPGPQGDAGNHRPR
jgi:two-component sensor histidine kinase